MRLNKTAFTALLLCCCVAAVVLTACAPPTNNTPTKDSNVKAAKSVIAAPTADALLALERDANEAYANGDGEFFEGLLSDKFVRQMGGSRVSKTELIKMISGIKCEVKQDWVLTEPTMLKIDDNAYVLSYESNVEGSCMAAEKTEKMPSPVRAATVWVSDGKNWQIAFHGESLIIDMQAPSATTREDGPGNEPMAAASATTTATLAVAKPVAKSDADPITNALMAAEHSAWEAWKDKSVDKIKALTAKEVKFVDIFGAYSASKAEMLKAWTGSACDVTSFKLTDGAGTSVSPTVAILTLTGTVNGTCSGEDISGQKVYANTVYVKDGNAWKWAFGFNSPT